MGALSQAKATVKRWTAKRKKAREDAAFADRVVKRWRKKVKELEAEQAKPGVWMDGVPRDPARSIGPWTVGKPAGCLHTTEGLDFAAMDRTLEASGSQPHFLVGRAGEIKQYRPFGDAATTLKNASGGVETNRKRLVQIEVCGFAKSPGWPDAQKQAVARIMAWSARHGVPLSASVRFTDAAGVRRLQGADWLNYSGWLGHQHVPENDHWDPGPVDITDLLNRARKL